MKQSQHHSRLLLIGLIGLTALIACQKPDEPVPTPIVPDSTPDAFSFANKTGVAVTGTEDIESEAITTLAVSDVDSGEAVFQTPATLAGTYGTFTFNTTRSEERRVGKEC